MHKDSSIEDILLTAEQLKKKLLTYYKLYGVDEYAILAGTVNIIFQENDHAILADTTKKGKVIQWRC